jgi:hypothetical protein
VLATAAAHGWATSRAESNNMTLFATLFFVPCMVEAPSTLVFSDTEPARAQTQNRCTRSLSCRLVVGVESEFHRQLEVATVPGAGHMRHHENPADSAQAG